MGKRKKIKLFIPVLRLLVTNFFEHDVGKNAAALAYYLLFALVFSIWFPMRAAKGLMDDVRLAYHLDKPTDVVRYTVRQLAYTIVLLLVIGLTLVFSTLGKQVLGYINYLIPEQTMRISVYFIDIWQYLRFVPVGLLMYAALGTLYAASLDKRQPVKKFLPGMIAALSTWMIVSVGFSFYVENFANYSVIYGTLGAVIVLLMWLYMTAVILILGAELNAAIMDCVNNREAEGNISKE